MELQQLQLELQKNIKGEVIRTDYWYIPVHTLKVSYKPVLKTKMDILMKMILLSVQEASFKNAQEISDILLVEELFIADLLKKMQNTELIKIIDNHFQLTTKGEEQLKNGVYEEEQPVKSAELLYSSAHRSTIEGNMEDVLAFDDYPEQLYRHYKNEEQLTIDDDVILHQLQKVESMNNDDEDSEKSHPLIVQTYDVFEIFQINDVPCIEFLVKKRDNGSLNVKVWNTLLNNWDETLEHDLKEKES